MRACETTCPSGVQYGRLLDIGRSAVAQRTRRPAGQAALRWLLRTGLSSRLFAPALALGRVLRPLLPAVLRDHIPLARAPGAWPARPHSRRMLLLAGCVQPAMLPNINAATARVLDALGVQLVVPPHAGCCGALHQHLDDPVGAQRMARRNIDAWWPHIESGCEAILVNASGCGAHVTEYAHLLRHDPGYAERARRVSTLAKDPCEVLPALLAMRPIRQPRQRPRVTFHPPCTLQHGLKIRGAVETMLTALGCELLPYAETHLCCGAAGTCGRGARGFGRGLVRGGGFGAAGAGAASAAAGTDALSAGAFSAAAPSLAGGTGAFSAAASRAGAGFSGAAGAATISA